MKKCAAVLAAAPLVMMFAGLAIPFGGASAQAEIVRPGIDANEWCDNQAPPCVVAASRNGVAIPETTTPTTTDPYVVSAAGSEESGEFLTQWSIADGLVGGDYATLATTDIGVPFSITVDVGKHDPRVVDEYAGGVSVTNVFNRRAGTWDVTVSGTAVLQGVNNDCNWTAFTCPYNDDNTIVAFQGEIGDWEQWPDSAQWNDFDGLDQWTNVEATAIPPQITGNPFTITEQLANSHELNNQLFEGFWDADLPNAFLVDMGINDPSTLTSAGISASVGTGTVTVTPGPTSTEIQINGITFSPRKVRIKRGKITPAAPTRVKASRVSGTVASLSFIRARPRGSYVRSYEGRCEAAHQATRYGTNSRSPVRVTGLTPGVSYVCQVRAKAVVGYGNYSSKTKLVR